MHRIFLNTLRPGQDGRHFADGIFTSIFINENCCILIKFSLKYVRKDPMDNNPALVQIMAWRRSGDKPLSEPIMVDLSTHICVTRPQWEWMWLLSHAGSGVIKAPLINFSSKDFFYVVKIPARCFESNSYLAGVTARWYVSNMNLI